MNLGYPHFRKLPYIPGVCRPSHTVHLTAHLLFSVSRVELIDPVQLAISIIHDAWPKSWQESGIAFALRLHVFLLLEHIFVEVPASSFSLTIFK